MQARIECMGTLPDFRWRMLNAHLCDPCVTPWFLLRYASVDFHYMPGSLFPSIVAIVFDTAGESKGRTHGSPLHSRPYNDTERVRQQYLFSQ